MNRRKILSAALVFMFLLVSFWLSAEESKGSPVAVSPGSETEAVSVWQSCPTFSWSAVDQASSYRIAVFEVIDPKVRSYEEIAGMASPLVSKDIPGPALSWTLPAEESLKTGSIYAWYVLAVDAYGNALGNWSGGKIFQVEQEIRFAGIEEKLAEKMREYGVNEETISNVLNDMKSEVKEVVVRGSSSKDTVNNNPGRSGVLGYEGDSNTFYGLSAGASNTSGLYNTFIGNLAGYSNTTGNFNAIFGQNAGVSNTTGGSNTFIGQIAGYSNTTGDDNTFIGRSSGYFNTTGYSNIFIGGNAGINNSTGCSNIFIGSGAGYNNTTGSANTFLGKMAGAYNDIGIDNTFLGNYAGNYNTSGSSNTFVGKLTGILNTTGSLNTFMGSSAGYSNTEGSGNNFLGYLAGYSNTTGNLNTFVGNNAGYKNTTGYSNIFIGLNSGYDNITGSSNIIIGNNAGQHNFDGEGNTFVGNRVGNLNTSGSENTFIGNLAGEGNTNGVGNTFIGNWAGRSNITGNNNVFLGLNAGLTNTTGIGNVFLGSNAGYNEIGSNKLYISNSDTSSPLIYGEFDNKIVTINGKLGVGTKTPDYPIELETTGQNAAFTTKRTDGATNFMSATASYAQFGAVSNHPVRILVNSTWKMMLNTNGSLSMANGATCTAGGTWTNASSRDLKENIEDLCTDEAMDALNRLNPVKYNYKVDKADKHVGFIAEDVPGIVATADRKGISPMDITAVLTRVVQEQQKLIREQQQVNQEYKKIISDLQERIAKIEKER